MSDFISVLASIMLAICIASYYYFTTKDKAKPNPATILVWWAVSILNFGSYFKVVNENYYKAAIAVVLTIGLSAVLVYAFRNGKFSRLAKEDMYCVGFAVIIAIFWAISGNAKVSNLLLQIIIVVSFFPTIRGLIQGTGQEQNLTWNLAVVAYILQTIAVYLDPEQTWISMAYPVINGIIGNGAVSVVIYFTRNRTKTP